jgi:predicted amidohydrolase
MIVAAYQAPLRESGSTAAIGDLAECIRTCETAGVEVLCCPEAVLGGLADDHPTPQDIALSLEGGQLESVLRPLASRTVTTVVGFTERAADGRLFNAAAVFTKGAVAGLYRKRHPARRVSVYAPGSESPVFSVGSQRFGILICNDSNHFALAEDLVSQGAEMLFVPSNNALRPDCAEVAGETRAVDIDLARRLGVPVIRADVAGRIDGRLAVGTSAIIDRNGAVLRAGLRETAGLLFAEV